jgi:hypothetical protein
MTAAKFKPFVFPVLGFALSNMLYGERRDEIFTEEERQEDRLLGRK